MEVRKKKKGTVWISGVCAAYQPAEETYMLTGRCIEILRGFNYLRLAADRHSDETMSRLIGAISRLAKWESGKLFNFLNLLTLILYG